VWLAFYIPALPLQAFSHTLIEAAPVVVFEREAQRSRVVARNKKAAQLGVRLNAALAEANALSDALVTVPREPLRERALLERMATSLSAITPNIHIRQHFGLLLEVSASLKLFGGAQALQQHVQTQSQSECVRSHVVIAPTASGARWLSRGHRQLVVEQDIDSWLDDLALNCTDFATDLANQLQALNLHTLAAVRRLPAAELNKRFGTDLSLKLAQAYGDTTESLPYWQPLAQFNDTVEFLDLVRERHHWMPGVEILLQRLDAFLRSRAASTRILTFCFRAGSHQQTSFVLQAAQCNHQASDWLRLFNARIERLPIAHEISSIELSCTQIEPMCFSDVDFFDRHREQAREWSALTTLLRLRLGDSAVRAPRHSVNALPESRVTGHPTESTVVDVAALTATPYSDSGALRPIWLIDPPRPLSTREIRTFMHSVYLQQPERIQENWAHPDGCDSTQRDYYIATTPDHRTLWVFRERPRNDWFLQGVFA
jgi:protein ImuB